MQDYKPVRKLFYSFFFKYLYMLVEHKPEIIEWVEVWEKQQTIPIRQMPAMTVKCVATTLSWEFEIVNLFYHELGPFIQISICWLLLPENKVQHCRKPSQVSGINQGNKSTNHNKSEKGFVLECCPNVLFNCSML